MEERAPRLWVAAAVWLAIAGVGLGALGSYAARAGAPARPPEEWPIRTRLEREAGRPVLLFFAHPACPCTRASAGELARLMAGAGRGVSAFALVSVPEGAPRDWADTDLVRGLAAIPGVRLVRDAGDLEAARFGVATSGQTLLYDGEGRLRFAGGITGARGHAGDNRCRDALERALLGGELGANEVPVFGCALDCPPGQGEVSWTQ